MHARLTLVFALFLSAAVGLLEPADDRSDWRAAFHVTAASAFLHLADPGDVEAVELAAKSRRNR